MEDKIKKIYFVETDVGNLIVVNKSKEEVKKLVKKYGVLADIDIQDYGFLSIKNKFDLKSITNAKNIKIESIKRSTLLEEEFKQFDLNLYNNKQHLEKMKKEGEITNETS